MSDNVQTLLIWNVAYNQLSKYIKQNGLDSYVKKTSRQFTAVTTENTLERGEQEAVQYSHDLETKVLLLLFDEDYGMHIYGFDKGLPFINFSLSEENGPSGVFPEDALKVLDASESHLDALHVHIKSLDYRKSWELLMEALQVDFDFNFSYIYFSNKSESFLSICGVKYFPSVTKKGKKISLKNIFKKNLEPFMFELGFLSDTKWAATYDFCFYKKVSGMDIGLEITKEDKSLIAEFKTLYDRVPFFGEGHRNSLRFNTETDVINIIDRIKVRIPELMLQYEMDLSFVPFDYFQLFNQSLIPFMADNGFKIAENTINGPPGGRLVLVGEGKNKQIIFTNLEFWPNLFCFQTIDGADQLLYLYNGDGTRKITSFRNSQDYLNILNDYKILLKEIVKA